MLTNKQTNRLFDITAVFGCTSTMHPSGADCATQKAVDLAAHESDSPTLNDRGSIGPETITNESGARMMLDALARYLAGKPVQALHAIAELVRGLPVQNPPGCCPMLRLSASDAAVVRWLAVQPRAQVRVFSNLLPDPRDVIEVATVVVGRLEISAQHVRTLTAEEVTP
jgi:hypothetical protein